MIFQPTSPIKQFQVLVPHRSRKKDQNRLPHGGRIAMEETSSVDKRPQSRLKSSQRTPDTVLDSDTKVEIESVASMDEKDKMGVTHATCESLHSPQSLTAVNAPTDQYPGNRRDTLETTNSSPTDPAYIPNQSGIGGQLTHPDELPRARLSTTTRPTYAAEQSFFDSDTESDDGNDEEPVIGRASSVSMSKPKIVGGVTNVRDYRVLTYGQTLSTDANHISTSSSYDSDVTDQTLYGDGLTKNSASGPTTALDLLEGRESSDLAKNEGFTKVPQSPISIASSLPDNIRKSGLFMNPVTGGDRNNIQRAISAPPLPHKLRSYKKVTIRPSDLIVDHPKQGTSHFRETVVTTPYPVLKEEDEEDETDEDGGVKKLMSSQQRSTKLEQVRLDNDRFPSPDRPEVLFLELSLANHPSVAISLEIKITKKATFDDEMLFQQIRQAYRNRLLGKSRLSFSSIRGVTHAVVSPAAQYEFRASEFLKHLNNPRIGRKRKTWVIWLRHHSLPHSTVRETYLGAAKESLPTIPKPAEKRLSAESDSSSMLNLPFVLPLSVLRIPFLGREVSSPSSISTSKICVEDGRGIVCIELYHEFSFWVLALLSFLVILSAVAAVVLWTVFGVPELRPGHDASEEPTTMLANRLAMATAVESRVLTGLVLGIMVALMGSMMEVCLIAGAYILL